MTSTLVSRLASAASPADIRTLLVDVLVNDWAAAAAIVWLPIDSMAEGDARADDVMMAGQGLEKFSVSDVLGPLTNRRIARWLAVRGLSACRTFDLTPPHHGTVVGAWNNPDDVSPHVDDTLGLLVAQIALLTDHHRLEERLEVAMAAQREAEDQILRTRRVRALGEMASGVVHDFNNCLTSILGFTELALGPLDEGDAFYNDLTNIRTSALDAAALVRRLQSFGRKGRDADEREVVDLRDVVRLMPTLARPRWMQASQCHGVSFDVTVEANAVPLVHVAVADIRELLLNLLFNAVDAMPNGGRIVISTNHTEQGWALVSVADEGIGMSEEVRQRIFQPFYSTKGDHGTGLGLSVCQTIAHRHGAELAVESELGKGTTFRLRIPPAPAGLIADPPKLRESVAAAPAPLGSQRVLLLDDQEEVRESVGEMLRSMGHHVTVADSGETAVALIGRGRIDALITDFGMPGMNGLEVAQRFRLLAPAVPVVLLTGWGLDIDAPRPSNVVSVLGKPVTMKSLSEALTVCASEARAEAWGQKCS